MLKINNLSYAFGTKQVLSNISLDIADGSFYAVMGANGCGKTTLLRCMDNLLDIPSDTVFLDGVDIRLMKSRQRATKIAYVAQRPTTDVDFSAFEIVLMGRNPYQTHLQNESQHDWNIVEQCMRQTNTWHLRYSTLQQMSGGEVQRVMIARALAQQTPILLLDEPLASLDISHQLEILGILSAINREQGKTIVLIIHDLNMALQHCPKLILLENQHIAYCGDTQQGLTEENIRRVFGINPRIREIDGQQYVLISDTEQMQRHYL